MSKPSHTKQKPARRPVGPAGVQAHLDSVMQRVQLLYSQDKTTEALELLEANRARLSQFAPFCAALATLYGKAGRHQEAAVQARLAVDLAPQNPDYYLAAAVNYFAAGYFSFAQRARQQWLRSAPYGPLLGEMRRLDEAYRANMEALQASYELRDTKVAEEAGYRLDEARWALAQRRWEEALKLARAAAQPIPGWPPPRNNAAAALSFLGRYAEAIAELESVLRECDPDNLHAVANLVRFHVITGDREAANRYADQLVRLPLPADPEGVVKLVEGLAFLDRDAEIDHVLTEARKRSGDLLPEAYVHWGIAAANAGRQREALAHLRRAQAAGYDAPLLRATLEALERKQSGPGLADRFPQTHFSDLIGREAIEETGKLLVQDEKRGERDDRAWADLLRRYPQLPLVVRRMLYELPDPVAPMAQLLAALRTPEAIETLREFVSGQRGTQDARGQVLQIMHQTGVLPPDAVIDMWIDGERHPIQSTLQTISDEFVPNYSQKVWDLYGEALTAHREGRIAEAERLYEAMLKAEPNAKEAYNNLAVIYEQRGDAARANAFLDKALAIDPLYVVARTARARQALAQGDVEAAKTWMEPLHQVRQWHPAGFAVYQKAMARIAIAEGAYEPARKSLELAKQFLEDDPEITELLNRLSLVELASRAGNWFQKYDERSRQRHLRKPLPADPTLADCLGVLSKGEMDGIAAVVGLRLRHPYKKADIQQHLLARLPDAAFLTGIVGGLNEAERAALGDLLAHGGVMAHDAFIQAHGDEGEDRPHLEYHAANMKSAKGRLRAHGLLFEGTAEGRVIVAAPRELRPLLREALARVAPGAPDSQEKT